MRIRVPGVTPPTTRFSIFFEGRQVDAVPGDTVAAALIDAGERSCRQAGAGDQRGVFCGMGVCTECAVVVDGMPGQLACMTAVRDGMQISLQPARTPVVNGSGDEDLPERELAPDVLVIGGGPGGLAAAAIAAEAGAAVVLVDERTKLGGQYHKQPGEARVVDSTVLDRQFIDGRVAADRARAAGVTILSGVTVWGAFAPDHLLGWSTEETWVFRPRHLILAPGAYERGVPVPGWTLPGVMTTGAAQTLVRGSQVAPGDRVLVAGNGPLNLQVAASLASAGVDVVALVELADLRPWKHISRGMRMASAGPSTMTTGLGYVLELLRKRVRILDRSAAIRFDGAAAVESATVAQLDESGRPIAGSEQSFAVDAVCVGYGFFPSNEISRALGCRHRYDRASGSVMVERSTSGRTSIPTVWVVGDGGGIGGAPLAKAMGTLAGAEAASECGFPVDSSEVRQALRRAERQRAFQAALSGTFGAPILTHQLADSDTVICRCETVTFGHIEKSIATGVETAGAIKRVTRAGMGKCQGRYCSPIITALAAERFDREIDEFSGFAPQPPIRPVPVSIAARYLADEADPIEEGVHS